MNTVFKSIRFSFSTPLMLAKVFLKIFLRDRQSIFFTVFFPIMFMLAIGMRGDSQKGVITIGVVNNSVAEISQEFVDLLKENPSFKVIVGAEDVLQQQLVNKAVSVVLVIPKEFTSTSSGVDIKLLIDSSHLQGAGDAISSLQKEVVNVERDLRGIEALLRLRIEDIQSRPLRYIDFLLPGILAFSLMQISISGSGFNIVEYRRKGILKRLFVTPVSPVDFISGVVLARLLLCVMQMSVLLGIAIFFMKVHVVGNVLSLYLIVVLGAIIFLCIGFTLGSIAKTQASIQALGNLVVFPQMFLSGIFYSIDSLPDFIQPIAKILPLSFVASALREISTNGMSLADVLPDIVGIVVWLVVGFVLATKLFVWKEVAS